MRFESFRLKNFRNISSAEIETDAEDIVLTGTNGQGKTSFLEAVYTVCYGSSFRTPFLKEEIKHGEDGFLISGTFKNEFGEKETINVSVQGNKRLITVGGKEIKDRKDLIYLFPCIAFVHEDIEFIKGEPEMRRRFFNQMMSLYSPFFFDDMRMYRAALSQRNAAIKSGRRDIVSLYNERLAFRGLEIMKARAEAVYDFNQIFPPLFRKISRTDMDLEIKYQPSWSADTVDGILEILSSTEERDMKMLTTTSGVHRDKFTIMSEYGPFQSTGSTGQIRLRSILMRMAEASYFTRMTGKKPVLLIDDVLLELDSAKRAELLSELSGYSQAYYTFLPSENYFGSGKKGIVYEVKEGEFHWVR